MADGIALGDADGHDLDWGLINEWLMLLTLLPYDIMGSLLFS